MDVSSACECSSLGDEDVVPMGGDGQDERFYATVDDIKLYGQPIWWLRLQKCRICGQNWMVAQEERIFDDYFVNRVSVETAEQIVSRDIWPSAFLTYEGVLKAGLVRSRPCRFADRLAGSLVLTARDLRDARPEISVDEIANLLGVDAQHAKELLAAMP